VTLRARWVTLRVRWVTLRARWVTLRARWVTLRARGVTLRARWVTLTGGRGVRCAQTELGCPRARLLLGAAFRREGQRCSLRCWRRQVRFAPSPACCRACKVNGGQRSHRTLPTEMLTAASAESMLRREFGFWAAAAAAARLGRRCGWCHHPPPRTRRRRRRAQRSRIARSARCVSLSLHRDA
jgi:hypothetical protein